MNKNQDATIYVGYYFDANQIIYAIGKNYVLELRKKYKKAVEKKVYSKQRLKTFLCSTK